MGERTKLGLAAICAGWAFWNAQAFQAVSIMTGQRVLSGPKPHDAAHLFLLWASCLLSVMILMRALLKTLEPRAEAGEVRMSFSAKRLVERNRRGDGE